MITILDLLKQNVSPSQIFDKNFGWGAKDSNYNNEINNSLSQCRIPVIIELEDDLSLSSTSQVIVIDHHGDSAGKDKPTSLHQVFQLLEIPEQQWTRRYQLVAANDVGHIVALQQCGATVEEMCEIRLADRRAQGITPEQEMSAAEGIANAQVLCDGFLTVVSIPHSGTVAVADLLESILGGQGYMNLLVVSPSEVDFYGEGKDVEKLVAEFPNCWSGGRLPDRGF